MEWIDIKKELPPLKKYVLIHVINKPWIDNEDDPFFRVAKLYEYIQDDKKCFEFSEFCGTYKYKLENIDYWCEIKRF